MAETRGLVQKLKVSAGGATFLFVGPSPTNTSPFSITRGAADTAVNASVKDDMVAAAAAAMVAGREVTVVHGDTSSEATSLRIDP